MEQRMDWTSYSDFCRMPTNSSHLLSNGQEELCHPTKSHKDVLPFSKMNAFDPWRCTPWRRIRNKGRDPPLQQRTRAVLHAKDKMHLPPRPLERVSVFPADFGLRPPASRQRDAFAGPSRFILATGKTQRDPATAKQSPDAT
ncbi:protein LTO1 homolog isoform X4 [Columba livia]|uniref:protein LTO1 homolog isoform X4 n=1 Tax=Columba livia TaxID=8932 RepID=UPI0031BA4902